MRKASGIDTAKDTGVILSDEEVNFLQDLRGFVDFGLGKGLPLPAIISVIGHDIDELARDRFDFDKAIKKRGFHPQVGGFSGNEAEIPSEWIERSKGVGAPVTKEEAAFLRDVQGFIDYGIRNGIPFLPLITTIAHDIHELQRDGLNFQEAVKKRGLSPKVSGYSRVTPESWEVTEE